MAAIHITDLEAAINHWRQRAPAAEGLALAEPTRALAEIYATLVYQRRDTVEPAQLGAAALDAWLAWYDSTPDTPCIAICTTSQGDDVCKGCGRTFEEIQDWQAMSPYAKRATWRRITQDNTAWRFNTYAERAVENRGDAAWACAGGGCAERSAGCEGGCSLGA